MLIKVVYNIAGGADLEISSGWLHATQYKKINRKRNIIYFNPPYNKNINVEKNKRRRKTH